MDSKNRISRRDMLKMSAAGAAGAAATTFPVGMAGASAPSQDEVVLNIDFRGYGADPTGANEVQGTALGLLLDDYHAMHPNVTVNHAPIDPGAWDDIQQWAARSGRARFALRQLDLPHRGMDDGRPGWLVGPLP